MFILMRLSLFISVCHPTSKLQKKAINNSAPRLSPSKQVTIQPTNPPSFTRASRRRPARRRRRPEPPPQTNRYSPLANSWRRNERAPPGAPPGAPPSLIPSSRSSKRASVNHRLSHLEVIEEESSQERFVFRCFGETPGRDRRCPVPPDLRTD